MGTKYYRNLNQGQCVLFSQLEWSMKLWWPHCEALIAYLMAYSHTKEPALLERFSQVYDYTFSHVSELQSYCVLFFLFAIVLLEIDHTWKWHEYGCHFICRE